MLDQYKTIEKLSALRTKILEKFELEDIEKLHDFLMNFDKPWFQFASFSFSKDFPAKEILAKKKFSTTAERANLFFQSIVLETAIAVLEATKNLSPGDSEYDMLSILGQNLRTVAGNYDWAFSCYKDDPRKIRTKMSKGLEVQGNSKQKPMP